MVIFKQILLLRFTQLNDPPLPPCRQKPTTTLFQVLGRHPTKLSLESVSNDISIAVANMGAKHSHSLFIVGTPGS